HDLASGAVRTYYNAPGNICGGADTAAFPLPAKAAGASAGIDSSAEGIAPGPGAGQGTEAASGLDTAPQSAPAAATWTAQPFEGGPAAADEAASSSACTPGPQTLCLLASRFQVTSRWRLPSGPGLGTAVSEGDQTGAFWFFDPANLELLVKVIDGRALTGHFWFFYGALSNVE